MRRIAIAFARMFVAIGLVAIGMVLQRDSARAMDGVLVYALTAPNPTPVPSFGSAVAAGDVNGDGRADVIVGAPGQNEAHVFSGANGALLYSLSAPDPQPDAGFGKAVAAGDVNGDGKADVIVAAQFQNVGGISSQGRVYVFSGTDGALLRTIDTPNPSPSGFFGSAVATGDVNGDGKADIIVAAVPEISPSFSSGRVYIFSGGDGSLIYSLGTPYPAVLFGQFGTAVAAGDVDGDGKADTIVGAWLGDFVGGIPFVYSYAYIFSGADSSLLRTLQRPVYVGRDDKFGKALAAGDVDGDAKSDVIVGDPAVGGFVLDPSVFAFRGTDGSLLFTLHQPNPIPGQTPAFGTAVAAGDVNGDGKADAIVGMLPDPFAVPNVGRVYVFSGADGSLLNTLDTPDPNIPAAAFFGTAVAAGGVTGDGKAAVVVGAPDNAIGGTYTHQGWAYVFAHESDGDGCADAKELLLVPPTDPLNPWDFFSVPVPALFAAQYPTTDFRDSTVSAADAQASSPTSRPVRRRGRPCTNRISTTMASRMASSMTARFSAPDTAGRRVAPSRPRTRNWRSRSSSWGTSADGRRAMGRQDDVASGPVSRILYPCGRWPSIWAASCPAG